MENAVDALKIAFAVMVFTIALSVAMATFSQARETSEAVLYMNDKTNYYSWEDEANYYETVAGNITYKSERIVGIDAIIPTLYRYYKENYTVIFELDNAGTKLPIYNVKIENNPDGTIKSKKWLAPNSGISEDDTINYFDLNTEIAANCPWVGTVNDIKKNLDLFLKGTDTPGLTPEDKSFGNIQRQVKYQYGGSEGFMEAYANAKFLEELGEYSTDRNYGIETDSDNNKWLVINGTKYKFDSDTGMVSSDPGETGVIDTKISTFLKDHGMELDIGDNATTQWNEDTDWEVVELAKPTIKRVIKYTLIDNP